MALFRISLHCSCKNTALQPRPRYPQGVLTIHPEFRQFVRQAALALALFRLSRRNSPAKQPRNTSLHFPRQGIHDQQPFTHSHASQRRHRRGQPPPSASRYRSRWRIPNSYDTLAACPILSRDTCSDSTARRITTNSFAYAERMSRSTVFLQEPN